MKKLVLSLSTFALFIASIFVFASCEKEEKEKIYEIDAIQLNPTTANFNVTDSSEMRSSNSEVYEEINEIDDYTFPNGFSSLFGIYEIQQTEYSENYSIYHIQYDDAIVNNISIPSRLQELKIAHDSNETKIYFTNSQIMLSVHNQNGQINIISNKGTKPYTDNNINQLSNEEQLELQQLVVLYTELSNGKQPAYYRTNSSSKGNTQYAVSIRTCQSTAVNNANITANEYVKHNPDCKREKIVNVSCIFGNLGCIAIVVIHCK